MAHCHTLGPVRLGCFHTGILEVGPTKLWARVRFIWATVNTAFAPKQPYQELAEVVPDRLLTNSGAVPLQCDLSKPHNIILDIITQKCTVGIAYLLI